jgi:hypothetical protein
MMDRTRQPQGSTWHRWDPHIHAPGTIFNDGYRGVDAWEQFLTHVEKSDPSIRALGITDYFSVDVYQTVVEKKKQGRLAGVDLIFPNVELRYGIGTGKNSPINFHLLVSPDDPDHVEKIRRFLLAFTFDGYGETYRCDRDDLIRLGKAHDKTFQDDHAALAAGANQFKVNPDQFRAEWKRSSWVQQNVLVAIAAGSNDGTSGLQGDSSLATLRQEIERSAHIIFSAQSKQREFWLGRGAVTVEKLRSNWGGCKPCLHGSDAHEIAKVGAPDLDRYCWIKGDLSFESLRQTCLEPETRVHIGSAPPQGAMPSQVIASVMVTNTAWLKTPSVPLNSGLVGIIGARGSGKTALADIIAAGGSARYLHENERSFIRRAEPYLRGSAVCLTWSDGNSTETQLAGEGEADYPSIQYLSQQFVDRLCSADGLADELLLEIERVIHQAHPPEDRMRTATFQELLEIRTEGAREARERREAELAEATRELNIERERDANLPSLQRQRSEKDALITKDRRDRQTLLGKGSEQRSKEFDLVSAAAEKVLGKVEQARRQLQALRKLKDEVTDIRTNRAPRQLTQLQQAHGEAKLTPEQWKDFRMDFAGDVDGILTAATSEVEKLITKLSGPGENDPVPPADGSTPAASFLPQGADPEKQTLSLLNKEIDRLQKLIGIDREKMKAFTRLSDKISRDEAVLSKLDREIETAKKAKERIAALIQSRGDTYAAVFDGIIEEENELKSLYSPLKARLEAEAGALGKLSFSIRRSVDVETWASQGEMLLDLRKTGPFKGRGALLDAAKEELCPAWQNGSSPEIADAMAKFRDKHERAIRAHSLAEKTNPQAYRKWAGDVAAWLYSTDHIKVTYNVQYDGVEIEQLSPGTRGIVLLLLFLAIDRDDDRPLIIDQPEENLDPKSIFDELVDRFRKAKQHRQIIIVTHNANLVVNTDADQVIVANCDRHRPGELPEISYQSGGLEDPEIRRQVCEILEGGEAAFQERAKRLRLKL